MYTSIFIACIIALLGTLHSGSNRTRPNWKLKLLNAKFSRFNDTAKIEPPSGTPTSNRSVLEKVICFSCLVSSVAIGALRETFSGLGSASSIYVMSLVTVREAFSLFWLNFLTALGLFAVIDPGARSILSAQECIEHGTVHPALYLFLPPENVVDLSEALYSLYEVRQLAICNPIARTYYYSHTVLGFIIFSSFPNQRG